MRAFGLVVGLGCLLSAGCVKPVEWKEYTSAEGRFSVLLPGTPKEGTRAQAGLTVKSYGVEVKNGAYAALYTDLPPGTPFDCSAAIRAMADNSQGQVLSETDFDLGGSKGKAFEVEVGRPRGHAAGRMVVVDGRLYQLIVMGADLRASDPDVQTFLGSFRLTRPPPVDGAGEAELVAKGFVEDLGAKRIEQAYQRLSAARQAAEELPQFRASIQRWPGLQNQKSYSLQRVPSQPGGPPVRYIALVASASGPDHSVDMELLSENGKWKIRVLGVFDQPGSGPP
jgi:hypothetical protein